MKWVSRDFIHFDRVVTPWLIKRFVDPQAEFILVPWGKEDERPADAIPYAIPGVELGPHDAEATTFDRVMRKYELENPALTMMAQVVRNGVNKTLFNIEPSSDRAGKLTYGIMGTIEAIMLSSATDRETLDRATPVLDALYGLFVAEEAAVQSGQHLPPTGVSDALWRTAFNCAVVLGVRGRGTGFDGRTPIIRDRAFEARLAGFQENARTFDPGKQ
jgi:hypothetical protein